MSWASAAVMLFTLGSCASPQGTQKTPLEVPAKTQDPFRAAVGAPQTEEQKTFYALGLALAQQTDAFTLSAEELEYVKAGMTAHTTGQKPAVDLHVYRPKLPDLAHARSMARTKKEKEKSRVYLETVAKEPGAQRTESGLIYTSIIEGTGEQPTDTDTDTVKVNYLGILPDGKDFDSSYKRNEPAEFPLKSVIPCWIEGLQKMKVGGKAKLVCPSELAYGDRGLPNIPGGSALIFYVDLLDVQKSAPPAPEPSGLF
jgi:FKBP-type peptidyl-prolyl cis-trans isomerase FkpA